MPPWLSLPLLQGSIGVTDASGNLSLTASTTGLAEDLATPYEAQLNLHVTSQRDKTFMVRVLLYVTAPTLASMSIWGTPTTSLIWGAPATSVLKCQNDALRDSIPITAVVGEAYEVPFTACDFEGFAVNQQ